MYAGLAFLLISKVGGWFVIVKNVPQNEKLALFLDYYVQQLLENRNVPAEMWNVQSGVWNFNLKRIMGEQQPDVFLLVQKLREKAESVFW
jgi:hypothetical protein